MPTGRAAPARGRNSEQPNGAGPLPLTAAWIARSRERSGRELEREHVDAQSTHTSWGVFSVPALLGSKAAVPHSPGEPAGAASRQKTRPDGEPAWPTAGTSAAAFLSHNLRLGAHESSRTWSLTNGTAYGSPFYCGGCTFGFGHFRATLAQCLLGTRSVSDPSWRPFRWQQLSDYRRPWPVQCESSARHRLVRSSSTTSYMRVSNRPGPICPASTHYRKSAHRPERGKVDAKYGYPQHIFFDSDSDLDHGYNALRSE